MASLAAAARLSSAMLAAGRMQRSSSSSASRALAAAASGPSASSAAFHSSAAAAAVDPQGDLHFDYSPKWDQAPHVMASHPRRPHNTPLIPEEHYGTRRISLNRHQSLNTLDATVINELTAKLQSWEKNPAVEAVIVDSNLSGIMTSGDDIAYLHKMASKPATKHKAVAYFKAGYRLNHLLATFTKPIVMSTGGASSGSAMPLFGRHVISDETSSIAFPETGQGRCIGGGASYVLSRLPDGVGMYLALTGDKWAGEDLFWSRLSTMHCEHDVLLENLPYVLGRASATERSHLNIEDHPVYKRNLKTLRKTRGRTRWDYVLEESSISSQDLQRYATLKSWAMQLQRHVPAGDAERWFQQERAQVDELGQVFDFGDSADVNDYHEPAEPEHRFQLRRIDNAVEALAMMEAEGVAHAHINSIRDCFAGDADKGDAVLLMAKYAKEIQPRRQPATDAALPADWESHLTHSVSNLALHHAISNGVVPSNELLEALGNVIRAGVVAAFPRGNLGEQRAEALLKQHSLEGQAGLVDATCAAVHAATRQIPGSAVLSKAAEEEAARLPASFGEDDEEDEDPMTGFKTQYDLHHPGLDIAALEPKSLSDKELALCIKSLDDFLADKKTADTDVWEPPTTKSAKTEDLLWARPSFTKAELKHIRTDPDALLESTGMPDTPDARKAMRFVVAALAEEEKSHHAVPQVKSVEEVMDRLANHDDKEWSQGVMDVLATKSPTALKLTHQLLTQASSIELEEALTLEFRAAVRMLDHADFEAGCAAAQTGASPVWTPATLADVPAASIDALLAPWADNELSWLGQNSDASRLKLGHRARAWRKFEEEEERWHAELDRWFRSGAVTGTGAKELRARYMWM